MTVTSGDRRGHRDRDPVLAVVNGSVGSEPVVKQARAELSTTRLLEAAAELIRDRGYEGTTLAAIGERAGYSHGLATRRFGNKEGLLGVLLDRMVMDWREHELRDAIGDLVGADAIEAMVDAVRTSIRRSPSRMQALYALTFQSLLPTPILRERMIDIHRAWRQHIRSMVVAGIEAGTVRPDADPEEVAGYVVAGLRGAPFQWLLDPEEFDIDAALGALIKMVKIALVPVES
jgi:AcrR family transcriptional regulator